MRSAIARAAADNSSSGPGIPLSGLDLVFQPARFVDPPGGDRCLVPELEPDDLVVELRLFRADGHQVVARCLQRRMGAALRDERSHAESEARHAWKRRVCRLRGGRRDRYRERSRDGL
jgi:hypothetical protein